MEKERTLEKEMADTRAEMGTGSIYAELGLQNHAQMEAKADLVIEIGKAIKEQKLTQGAAARLFGISEAKLSELLSGHFRGYSASRLMEFLFELGEDVETLEKTKSTGH